MKATTLAQQGEGVNVQVTVWGQQWSGGAEVWRAGSTCRLELCPLMGRGSGRQDVPNSTLCPGGHQPVGLKWHSIMEEGLGTASTLDTSDEDDRMLAPSCPTINPSKAVLPNSSQASRYV